MTLAKAVMTTFQAAGQSGLGISNTLQERIYAYVFGERMGTVGIGGIAFAGVCNNVTPYTGFDAVYAFYERMRVSTQGMPCRLILGPNTVLNGLLKDFTFSLEDANTGVGSFSFVFKVIPRISRFGGVAPLPWE